MTNDGEYPGNSNIIYNDPISLFKYWSKFDNRDKELSPSFIKCPAFQNISKNTYVFNFPIDSSYVYVAHSNKKEDITILPITENFIEARIVRDKYFDIGPSINLEYKVAFFSDESVEIMLTGPYFNKAEYTKYGSITAGQFDIGQWFRTIETEIQLFSNEGEIHFKKDEPIFYIKVLTDKKVNLQRFELTKDLASYIQLCIASNKRYFGFGRKLKDYYQTFNSSRTRDIVLKKIKENLI